MRSTSKTVLYARHNAGKTTITYPVSVHVSRAKAGEFRDHLNKLHVAGDHDAVKALIPGFRTAEDGRLHDNVQWSMKELPYDPSLPEGVTVADDFDI
jgi:hypothetical protein